MGSDCLGGTLGAKSFCELPKITWLGDDLDHKISEHELSEGKGRRHSSWTVIMWGTGGLFREEI